MELVDLEPGLHIVTENSAEDRGPRGELVRARWPLDLDPEHLRAVLALHAPRREGTCIHLEPLYGTRSSFILRRASSLAASLLLVSDGPPCSSPLEDRTDLIQDLARSP